MVPVRGVPPAIALTLQETVVSAAPVTVAEKFCVLPRRSEAEAGVMVTVTEGEGGGDGAGSGTTAVLALPVLPAQPSRVQAAVARIARMSGAAKRGCAALRDSMQAFCRRGRMVRRNAGEGPGGKNQERCGDRFTRVEGGSCKVLELGVLG